MSNKSRGACKNDLRVGRTLFICEGEHVQRITITKVVWKFLGYRRTAQVFYNDYECRWRPGRETYFFAGDRGVRGERYDNYRPCMVFTNRSAAVNNLPKMIQWREYLAESNRRFDAECPDWTDF